jgi:hypothetical protein
MRIRWGTRLTVAVSALAAAGLGLVSAGAGAAMASTGTSGPGSWQFQTFDSNWHVTNGIVTTGGGQPTTQYQATVQQPINAPGQIPSVFSNKTRTIPVKYQVQSRTCTPGTSTTYPGVLKSFAASENPSLIATNLNWAPPSGSGLTVGQISSLVAHFTWTQGSDHGGSLRWQIDTPDGALYVYYGDSSTDFQTDSNGPDFYSGTNMMGLTDIRAEFQGFSNPEYDTLSNIFQAAAPTPSYGTIGQEPVLDIGLVTDSGWGGDQQVTLQDAAIITPAGTSTYVPGTVSTTASCTSWTNDTTDPMWLYLAKTSGSTPAQQIDESLIDNTQGDTGGQFRVVNGFYMYNLPLSQLTDLTATYTIGISPNSDGSNPVGLVSFGLK